MGFGPLGTHGGRSNGIVFETPHGADVRAPIGGMVVHAGEFHSYGNLVTIAIGCGMQVMIAGLGNITVAPGERIGSGQTLGTTSEGHGSPLPVIYLELRRDGQPIDPGLLSPGKQ
jgi:murein hydrolase activator